MADEAKNIGGLFKNERTRMVLVLTGVALAVAAVVGVTALRSKTPNRPHGTGAEASLAAGPDVHDVPGTSTSPVHQQLVNEANQQGAQQALSSGGSFVPTLVASPDASQKNPFDLAPQKGPATPALASAPVATAPQQPAQPVQQAQQPVQQPQQQVDPDARARAAQREQIMASAMQKLLDGWVPGKQALESDYTGGAKGSGPGGATAVAANGTQGAVGGANAASAKTVSADAAESQKVVIHAASIIPAVLMTSINSDEPGPVLAQIVTGPFEGARALGQFTKPNGYSEKTVLQFTTLSMPGTDGKTLAINAFAVDPESARTALATDVDHHYLSRYGLLFASAFLSGYGQALQSSGATTTTSLGTTTTTYPQISAAQKAYVALGQVGQTAGTVLQQDFNRPTTIMVAQGTPLGLLFMQDVKDQQK
jgi:intracellular multiplication protein IcmE